VSRYRYRTLDVVDSDWLEGSAATLDAALLGALALSKTYGPRVYVLDCGTRPPLIRGFALEGKPFVWMKDCRDCKGRGTAWKKHDELCDRCAGRGRVADHG
jgi:hypothetical protein